MIINLSPSEAMAARDALARSYNAKLRRKNTGRRLGALSTKALELDTMQRAIDSLDTAHRRAHRRDGGAVGSRPMTIHDDAEKLRELRDVLVGFVPASLVFDPFDWAETLDDIADRLDRNRPVVDVPLPDPGANGAGLVRRDAPSTSRKAALDVMPRTGTQRRRVLNAIARAPRTDEELQDVLRLDGNSERPRRVELVDGGWVEPSGEERDGAIVWHLTERAEEALR